MFLDKKKSVGIQNLEKVKGLYDAYREADSTTVVDTGLVKEALNIFGGLVLLLDNIRDEYEFSRRLISSGRLEGNVEDILETIPQKVERTKTWLDKQEKMDASQAENIFHNLYYILSLHEFKSEADDLIESSLVLCDKANKFGIFGKAG